MDPNEIRNVQAEAAILATLIRHTDYVYYSEDLEPRHFADLQNAYMYESLREMAHKGIKQADAFNIISALDNMDKAKKYEQVLKISSIQEFIRDSEDIIRNDIESYKLAVSNVLNAAFRRDVYRKLRECEGLCLKEGQTDLGQKVYEIMDSVLLDYSTATDVPQFKDVVDDLWEEIKMRQDDGMTGIPFKFPTLNNYVKIEPGELVVFAADAKQGKSMMLLNCAVDLLKQGKKVLYIDSELNSRLFACRLLAHLAHVRFQNVRDGTDDPAENRRIGEKIEWLKTTSFTHIYMPLFDIKTLYSAVKKVYHTQGIDVIIIDYFKSTGDSTDAYAAYQELGKLVDTVKNVICGSMNIAGLAAAQATVTGKIADSAKIARNASTIIMIQSKSPQEVLDDGPECGNKKLRVVLNRNGMQMAPDEYIDLQFDGDFILYTEAKQHQIVEPF